jgi:hypothetical protein
MALGSWQGLYNAVIEKLMGERREQELLLLMAIARHCDPFGFCFPGRAKLKKMRHCGDTKFDERIAFLQERGHIVITQFYNARRRQFEPDYQVSPRVLYVRADIQVYCEAVFDGERERDFSFEKSYLSKLLNGKDSQTEVVPESENRRSKPDTETSPKTRNHNQLRNAPAQKGRKASTMRNGEQPTAKKQPTAETAIAHREETTHAGGDEFDALLSPTVDDDRLIQEIKHAVATTAHQAADVVERYPRDGIVHWLRHTAIRRAKGELKNPGGYFYKMLTQHCAPNDEYQIP